MESYEKKIIDISPQYLIEISKFVEILSAYYEQ
jgi:preprotein translocase subunit Sec61beta